MRKLLLLVVMLLVAAKGNAQVPAVGSAEAVTPDIQALAGNLGNDPTRIFNYVHDHIRHVLYFGSLKGAEMTLLERSGNDFDQCALLSALLSAAGYSPGYQFGYMKMPYSSTNHQDLQHWLCLNLQTNDWGTITNYMASLIAAEGYPVASASAPLRTFSGDTNDLAIQRVWVTLSVSGTNYYLDPAFKDSEPVAGINLASAMGFNSNSVWSAAGGTDAGYAVKGLTESTLRGALQGYNSTLQSYLAGNMPNASVMDVMGGRRIVSSYGQPLATSLAFSLATNSTYPLLNWTSQPTNFMSAFGISFAGTNQTWYVPQLQGQRISLTFSSTGLAQLWQDDAEILQTTNTGSGKTFTVSLTVTHPYGGWSTSLNAPVDYGHFDKLSLGNSYYRSNASYAIIYAFDASPELLQARQRRLNAYKAQGLADTSTQVTTETLNVMGLTWMMQTELASELIAGQLGVLTHNHHRIGRMAQESGNGYYVDAYLQLDGSYPATGTNDLTGYNQRFDVSSYFGSAMEHGVIEQLQDSGLTAASTVKMLQIANANSQTNFLVTSNNWNSITNGLSGYSSLSAIESYINSGYAVLLPAVGNNTLAGAGTFDGNGYAVLGTNSNGRYMGMYIGDHYNGGYVDNLLAQIEPAFIQQSGNAQPLTFNPASATLQNPVTVGDPINPVDGSFQVSSGDLSMGGREPRGLNFSRFYSSSRRFYNPANLGPGWVHSYYGMAQMISDPQLCLGGGTAEQMTPMIVATVAVANFYNSASLDAKNWMTTALIAKWGIDQLIGTVASVTLGKDTIEFVQQPDGSFTPPANCASRVWLSGGALTYQERHGRTFVFNSGGYLTKAIDAYSNMMTFAYNGNNLLTSVTDWKSQTFTLTYSGNNLTNVFDGTRTARFGYTGSNLTSYTDPEGKVYSYQYDSSNQLIATFDANSSLVVTNTYDGFGHVVSQLTTGATNKLWQVSASGFDTELIDPAGGRQHYFYDDQARLTGMQDALGNFSQTVYDGQDHVIETISPLNETNQFIYDGNNNLIETIDPLGRSNVFAYDGYFNLMTLTDGRGNASHFGYNGRSDLTGSTNGNGDWLTLSYNSDGTVASRTDAGGATTFGYDGTGGLNSITYPGSLGSESFGNNVWGEPTNHVDARGLSWVAWHNHRGQLTNSVSPARVNAYLLYDANGNLQETIDPRGLVMSNYWSVTKQLLSTTLPAVSGGAPIVYNAYDNRDWLASTRDPLGRTNTVVNDLGERLIATADPLNRTNTFAYDPDSHQTNITDAANEKTSQTFDADGELVHVFDAATNNIGKAYDAAHNLIYLTNRNGKVWQFQYDGANRLTDTISPLGHSASVVYNNRGLLQSSTDPMSQTTTLGYDARGRMTSKADPVGTNLYTYDLDNNLTVLSNSGSGIKLGWGYDSNNWVTACTNAAGYVIQYQHDNDGNVTNLIYPGGRSVTYYFDGLNRMTNIVDWAGRQTTFTYDLAGHITNMTRPNNTVRTMVYDPAGQLTNIVDQTTTHYPIAFFDLHHDLAGRIDWEFKGPPPHAFTPPTRTMTFDDDDRLSAFNGSSVTLDNDGNLTSGPFISSTFSNYTYDARNELTSGGGLTYGYDSAGNRVAMTNGSTVTSFVINPTGSQVLMRIKGTTTNYYVYGAAGLAYEVDETSSATNAEFYHFDIRGSTVALTDKNGNPTDGFEYSPYGMTTYRFGSTDTPFHFNGAYGVQTDANGLLFMRARYYNPYICRFINPDPSGFGGGLNYYAFCNGNPVSLTDPFGLGVKGEEPDTSWLNNNLTLQDIFNQYDESLQKRAVSLRFDDVSTGEAVAMIGTGPSMLPAWGYVATLQAVDSHNPFVSVLVFALGASSFVGDGAGGASEVVAAETTQPALTGTEAARAALGLGQNAVPGAALTPEMVTALQENLAAAQNSLKLAQQGLNIAGNSISAEQAAIQLATTQQRINAINQVLQSGVQAAKH